MLINIHVFSKLRFPTVIFGNFEIIPTKKYTTQVLILNAISGVERSVSKTIESRSPRVVVF